MFSGRNSHFWRFSQAENTSWSSLHFLSLLKVSKRFCCLPKKRNNSLTFLYGELLDSLLYTKNAAFWKTTYASRKTFAGKQLRHILSGRPELSGVNEGRVGDLSWSWILFMFGLWTLKIYLSRPFMIFFSCYFTRNFFLKAAWMIFLS